LQVTVGIFNALSNSLDTTYNGSVILSLVCLEIDNCSGEFFKVIGSTDTVPSISQSVLSGYAFFENFQIVSSGVFAIKAQIDNGEYILSDTIYSSSPLGTVKFIVPSEVLSANFLFPISIILMDIGGYPYLSETTFRVQNTSDIRNISQVVISHTSQNIWVAFYSSGNKTITIMDSETLITYTSQPITIMHNTLVCSLPSKVVVYTNTSLTMQIFVMDQQGLRNETTFGPYKIQLYVGPIDTSDSNLNYYNSFTTVNGEVDAIFYTPTDRAYLKIIGVMQNDGSTLTELVELDVASVAFFMQAAFGLLLLS
jgi:hypothetical protein